MNQSQMNTSFSFDNLSTSATSSLDPSSTSSSQTNQHLAVAAAPPPPPPPPPPLPVPPRRLPSSQYKGVVPQPNGRWGAQIYERHSRVWLGTFDSEISAAKAYDIAAQQFRGRDAVTNFRPLSESDPSDLPQLHFLKLHSKSEIVDMLRKHTFREELEMFAFSSALSSPSATSNVTATKTSAVSITTTGTSNVQYYEHLFDKTVTPSDVGKLNRLVVPKQHAEKYFPLSSVNGAITASIGADHNKGFLLSFEEKGGGNKVWRFRYSYWNSSQSYVLTKGWSRFVKEKGLRAGDVISFHRLVGPDKRIFIDWKIRRVNSFPVDMVPERLPSMEGVVRLFGVDLVMRNEVLPVQVSTEKVGSRVVEDPGFSLKRIRGLENDSLVSKKQCLEA